VIRRGAYGVDVFRSNEKKKKKKKKGVCEKG
jgi:hypothetical protein